MSLNKALMELVEQRTALKEWLESHDAEHEEYSAKKEESKALKAQIRVIEAEEDAADEAAAAVTKKKPAATAAEDTEDHSLRTLNEWKSTTGHNYKCFIELIKTDKDGNKIPAGKKDEKTAAVAEEEVKEEDKKDGEDKKEAATTTSTDDKKKSQGDKKKKAAGGTKKQQPMETGDYRCTLTAVPKKVKSNMFEAADETAPDLAAQEAPKGIAEAGNKKDAKRLAAGALIVTLSEEAFSQWGLNKNKVAGAKSARFVKMEAMKPKALNMVEGQDLKHPCIRVWGKCTFDDDCQYALFPYNTCLSFIKGKCTHGEKCVEPHDVDVNDPQYKNNTPKPRPTHDKFSGKKRAVPEGTKCFKCGEEGHMTKECPQGSGSGCFKCGETGHMSRECPNKPAEGGRGRGGDRGSRDRGGDRGGRGARGGGGYGAGGEALGFNGGLAKGTLRAGLSCFHCGETTHLARDCPTGDGSGCFKCGEPGHMSRECPQGGADKCFECGEEGHMSRACPSKVGAAPRHGESVPRGGGGGASRGARGGGRAGGGAPSRGGRWGLEGRGFGYGDDNRPSKYQKLEIDDDDE